jgi:putative ABC transport system substrate-binding protein
VNRRTFVRAAPLALLASRRAAEAQAPGKVSRLGFLGSTLADEDYDRLPALATELLRIPVDILITYGTPATLVAKKVTQAVPIVMVHSGDAVASGIVPSLSRTIRSSRPRSRTCATPRSS